MRVKEAITAYLSNISNETTKTNYRIALLDFLTGVTDLNSIDREKVEQYRDSLKNPQTIAARLAAIRGFLDFCWEKGWVNGNPALTVRNIKYEKYKNSKNISMEEFQKILLATDSTAIGLRDNLILRLVYFMGDVTKVSKLGWRVTLPGKLEKLKIAYKEKLLQFLMASSDLTWEEIENDYMFFALEPATPKKPLSSSALRKLLNKYANLAGLPEKSVDFQAIKRLRAKEIYNATKSVTKVMEFCGHSCERVTKAFLKDLL